MYEYSKTSFNVQPFGTQNRFQALAKEKPQSIRKFLTLSPQKKLPATVSVPKGAFQLMDYFAVCRFISRRNKVNGKTHIDPTRNRFLKKPPNLGLKSSISISGFELWKDSNGF
jgi:hypothetical protein